MVEHLPSPENSAWASPFTAWFVTTLKTGIGRLGLGFIGVHLSHGCTEPLPAVSCVWSMNAIPDKAPLGSQHLVVGFGHG